MPIEYRKHQKVPLCLLPIQVLQRIFSGFIAGTVSVPPVASDRFRPCSAPAADLVSRGGLLFLQFLILLHHSPPVPDSLTGVGRQPEQCSRLSSRVPTIYIGIFATSIVGRCLMTIFRTQQRLVIDTLSSATFSIAGLGYPAGALMAFTIAYMAFSSTVSGFLLCFAVMDSGSFTSFGAISFMHSFDSANQCHRHIIWGEGNHDRRKQTPSWRIFLYNSPIIRNYAAYPLSMWMITGSSGGPCSIVQDHSIPGSHAPSFCHHLRHHAMWRPVP